MTTTGAYYAYATQRVLYDNIRSIRGHINTLHQQPAANRSEIFLWRKVLSEKIFRYRMIQRELILAGPEFRNLNFVA
jgi:hypothetical protein